MTISNTLPRFTRTLARGWLVAAAWLVLAITGRATTVKPPEFSDLVNQSDYIVRAVVKSVRSELIQTAQGHKIYTYVELDVREEIAGTPPRPLVLRILGGQVGKETMFIQGVPQFQEGDEEIFFVQGNGQQIYPLVAMMHGRYPVQRETATGRRYMARSNRVPLQSTVEVAKPMSDGNTVQRQQELKNTARALAPDQFVQQIKSAVKPSNQRLREH